MSTAHSIHEADDGWRTPYYWCPCGWRSEDNRPTPDGISARRHLEEHAMPTLDDDVTRYTELADQIAELTAELKTVRRRLAAHGEGTHATASGLVVTVRPPSRSFNTDRGWTMLTPEQQLLCVSPDPKKIKAQLPGALLDACMDPGKGDPVVTIR